MLVEFREFFREPGVLFWAIAFPILMTWGLGVAFNNQGEQQRHVALVQSAPGNSMNAFFGQSDSAAGTVKKLGNNKLGYTNYHFKKANWEEAVRMIKRGEASLIIEENRDSVIYHFDPKNAEAQSAYMQISSAIKNGDKTGETENIHTLSEIGTRYVDFLVPGLLAMNIMFAAMWGISYTFIDRRSKKLLRRMVATPMSRSGMLFAHFTARLILSFVEAALLLTFAYFYFDIAIQGSIPAFILLLIAGNLVFFGIAILFSSRTANTQVGNGIINAVTMPMLICSGIFFSYHNFPDWIIPVIKVFPLTLIADTFRAIFIEGIGLQEALMPILILSGFGLLFFFVGYRIYKWY
jgi:ABC-type multidrug transport system permease subunit